MVANKRKALVSTTIFLALAWAGVAEAQLYSWRDGKGKMSYGSVCPAGATCKIKLSTGGWRTVTPEPTTTSTTTSDSTSTTSSTTTTTTTESTTTTTSSTTTGVAALGWDPVATANLAGYRIYWGTSPGMYFQTHGSGLSVGNVTTFSVGGLNSGTRYYFAATAQDSTGSESGYSNEVFKDIP